MDRTDLALAASAVLWAAALWSLIDTLNYI